MPSARRSFASRLSAKSISVRLSPWVDWNKRIKSHHSGLENTRCGFRWVSSVGVETSSRPMTTDDDYQAPLAYAESSRLVFAGNSNFENLAAPPAMLR